MGFFFAASPAAAADDLTELCGETVRFGVRIDAPPFALKTERGRSESNGGICHAAETGPLGGYAGFTVALCREFADAVVEACAGAAPPIFETVDVMAAGRDAMLTDPDPPFDLLCGSTTATISRAARLPNSPYIFVTGASPLVAAERFLGPDAQCRIAVVGGTTSDPTREGAGRRGLEADRNPEAWSKFEARHPACKDRRADEAAIASFESYDAAIAALLSPTGEADMLIGDRHILAWMRDALPKADAARLRLLDNVLSIEPYAVMAPETRGRLMELFSRFLARRQADGDFSKTLDECFPGGADPSLWTLIAFQRLIREGALLPR
jgi:ABC-type amino acid transport substrate-binding protein